MFWLDIYIATKDRSRACVDQFLQQYVDLQKENAREDFEVRMWNLEVFVETGTLQQTIELGLSSAQVSFTLYLSAKQRELKSVMVHFGKKGVLILGISIEEETPEGSNTVKAEQLLADLKNTYGTPTGKIVVEIPPVELEEELEKEIG